jgi:hypothetical protein
MFEHRMVVAEVERQEAAGVYLHRSVVASHPALALPQVRGVGCIEGRGAAVGCTGVSIETVGEGRAVGDADGVSTCTLSSCQYSVKICVSVLL